MLSVSFKSEIKPTPILERVFDSNIERGYEGKAFLKAVKSIMNDGQDDVFEISLEKEDTEKAPLKRINIYVNDKLHKQGDSFSHECFEEAECEEKLIDFAKTDKANAYANQQKPVDSIDKIRKIISMSASEKKIDSLTFIKVSEQLSVLEKDCGKSISRQLKNLKNKIFNQA